MKKIKLNRTLLLLIFLNLVVLVFLSPVFSSILSKDTSTAKYHSVIIGSDTTRVAKWDIQGKHFIEGEASVNMDVGFNETITGTEDGAWYLEISNESEVEAILNKNSSISFRLYHDSYNLSSPQYLSWNFKI